jgi:hypothetical protein
MRPGRDAGHTPTSSAEVKNERRYTSTHPMGPPGPVKGFRLPFNLLHSSSCKVTGMLVRLSKKSELSGQNFEKKLSY